MTLRYEKERMERIMGLIDRGVRPVPTQTLQQFIDRFDLTKKDAATLLCVSVATIYNILSGKRPPSAEVCYGLTAMKTLDGLERRLDLLEAVTSTPDHPPK